MLAFTHAGDANVLEGRVHIVLLPCAHGPRRWWRPPRSPPKSRWRVDPTGRYAGPAVADGEVFRTFASIGLTRARNGRLLIEWMTPA